jgi:sec-independent protein translocase protein TatC
MIKTILGSFQKKDKETEMGFFDHLETLRWHIIRSFIAILLGSTVIFIFYDWFFENIVFAPGKPTFITYTFFCKVGAMLHTDQLCFQFKELTLLNTELSGQLMTQFTTAFTGGIVVAFPYICFEVWSFIKPALQEKELSKTRPIILYTSLLFLTGLLFGYYIMTPFWLAFSQSFTISKSITNMFSLDNYISGVSTLIFSCGLIFELPVLIYFLSKLGLMTPKYMREYRRHAYVSIVILGAMITPQTDIFSLTMICLPLVVLYEASISVSARVEKKKRQLEFQFPDDEA